MSKASAPRAPRPPPRPPKVTSQRQVQAKAATQEYWAIYTNTQNMALLNKPNAPHHRRTVLPLSDPPQLNAIKPKAPSYTLSGRTTKAKMDNGNPGPGAYDPASDTYKKPAPRWAPDVGLAGQKRAVNPGPGTYDPILPKGRAALLLGRNEPEGGAADTLRKAKITPGPAEYSLPSCFGNNTNGGPKYSMAGRLPAAHEGKDQGLPGPGTYEMQNNTGPKSSKKFTLGTRWHDPAYEGNPGPGTYTAKSDFDYQDSVKKGFTIKGREAIDGRYPS